MKTPNQPAMKAINIEGAMLTPECIETIKSFQSLDNDDIEAYNMTINNAIRLILKNEGYSDAESRDVLSVISLLYHLQDKLTTMAYGNE